MLRRLPAPSIWAPSATPTPGLANRRAVSPTPGPASSAGRPPVEITDDDLALEDRWVLSRLASGVADCNANMQKRRLNDAAYDVFNFFRHEFCDWYLEAIKPRLRDEQRSGPALCTAVLGLAVSYKLLHPVMPFITEELWSWLPPSRGFLMVSSFPLATGEAPLVAERRLFERVMEIVTVIRNVRAELGVPPGKRGGAILRVSEPEAVTPLANCADLISLLAKLVTTEVVCGGDDPTPAGLGVAGNVEVFLPMKGLVDLDKERARLQKELGKIEGVDQGLPGQAGQREVHRQRAGTRGAAAKGFAGRERGQGGQAA